MNPPQVTPTSQVPSNRQALGYFWRLLVMIRAYWRRLVVGILVGVFMTVFALVPPYMTKLLVDNVYVTKDVSLLVFILLVSLAVTVASALIGAVRTYFTTVVGGELASATSLMFIAHVVAQPVSFFDGRRTGEILSRTNDARSSLGVVTRIFGTVLTSGIQLIIVPPILFYLNWKLALLSLIGLPVTTAISLGAARIVRRYAKLAAESSAEMSSSQIDALSQIRTVKLLCAEREMFEQIRQLSVTTLGLQFKSSAVSAFAGVLRAVVAGVATALFTWYGWISILNQSITLGGFLAFSAYLRYLSSPISSLSSLLTDFQTSVVSLGRLFEYLDLQPEIAPQSLYEQSDIKTVRLRGSVGCRDLSYSYPSGSKVLDGVEFEVPEGATMAIVGASGAGKSTLVRLLCKMDVSHSGVILHGGVPVSELRPVDVRSHVTTVWQETGLIRGTLRQNLYLGVQQQQPERLRRVLEICRLEDLLASLPDGLDAQLGEAGVRISGGQRQRIVLARALLRNTPLLILDEATSNIDSNTESSLLDDLFGMEGRGTIVYVTHRVHTAELADFVLCLNKGSVDGFGSHSNLLSESLCYRSLWKSGSTGEQPVAPNALVGSA